MLGEPGSKQPCQVLGGASLITVANRMHSQTIDTLCDQLDAAILQHLKELVAN